MADGLPAYWDRFSEKFFRESFSSAAEATASFSAWADELHRRDLSDPELRSRRVVEWALWIFGAKLARASLRIDQTGIDDLSGCDSLKALLFFKDAMVDTDTALVLSLFGQAARPLLSSDALTELLDEHEVDDESAILMHNSVFSDGIPGKIPATAAGWSAAASEILLGPFPAFQTTEVFMEKVTRLYGIAETQAPFFAKGAPGSSKMAVSPVDTPNSGQSQPHFRVSGRAHMAHLWKTLAEAPDNPRHVRSLVYSAHFLAHWSFMLRRRTLRGDEHKKIEAFIDAARAYLANVTDVSPETDAFGALRAVYDATVAGHICDMFTSVDILASVPADSTEWCLLTGFGLAPVPLDACAPLFGPVVHHKMSLFFEESARSAGVSAAQPVCTAGLLDYARSAVSSSTYSELTAEDGARLSALTDDLSGKLRPADLILYRHMSSMFELSPGAVSLSTGIRAGVKLWFNALAHSAELDAYDFDTPLVDVKRLDSQVFPWATVASTASRLLPRRATMWAGTVAGFLAIYSGISGLVIFSFVLLLYVVRGLLFWYKRSREDIGPALAMIDRIVGESIEFANWMTVAYTSGELGQTLSSFLVKLFEAGLPTSFTVMATGTRLVKVGYYNILWTLLFRTIFVAMSGLMSKIVRLSGRNRVMEFMTSVSGYAPLMFTGAFFAANTLLAGYPTTALAIFGGFGTSLYPFVLRVSGAFGILPLPVPLVTAVTAVLVSVGVAQGATVAVVAGGCLTLASMACAAVYTGVTGYTSEMLRWDDIARNLKGVLIQQFRDVRFFQGFSLMTPPVLLMLSNLIMDIDGQITGVEVDALAGSVLAVSSSPLLAWSGWNGAWFLAGSAVVGAIGAGSSWALRYNSNDTTRFVFRLQAIGISIALTGLFHWATRLYGFYDKRRVQIVNDNEDKPPLTPNAFTEAVQSIFGTNSQITDGDIQQITKVFNAYLGDGPNQGYFSLFYVIYPVVQYVLVKYKPLCRRVFNARGKYFRKLVTGLANKIVDWPTQAPSFLTAISDVFKDEIQREAARAGQVAPAPLDITLFAQEVWQQFFVVRYQSGEEGEEPTYDKERVKEAIRSKYEEKLAWMSDALFGTETMPVRSRDVNNADGTATFFPNKEAPIQLDKVPFYVQLALGSERFHGTDILHMYKFVLDLVARIWTPGNDLHNLQVKDDRQSVIDAAKTQIGWGKGQARVDYSENARISYAKIFGNRDTMRRRLTNLANSQKASIDWISSTTYSAAPDALNLAARGGILEDDGDKSAQGQAKQAIRQDVKSKFSESPILVVSTSPDFGDKRRTRVFEFINEEFQPTVESIVYLAALVWFRASFRNYVTSGLASQSDFVQYRDDFVGNNLVLYANTCVQLVNDTAPLLFDTTKLTSMEEMAEQLDIDTVSEVWASFETLDTGAGPGSVNATLRQEFNANILTLAALGTVSVSL